MKTTVYQVGQVPVLVHASQPGPETIYLAPGAQDIYVGGPNVTTSTGLQLRKNDLTPLFVRGRQTLYAICPNATHPLTVLSESP